MRHSVCLNARNSSCFSSLFASILFLLILSIASFCTAAESIDSQLFIEGFNAYQKSEYSTSADKMNQVLTKYPDTPLRDMALFWISRSHYKLGNKRDAGKYFSQFIKEYPESPLMGTADEELSTLASKYDKGEKLENAPKTAQVVQPPPPDKPSPVKPDSSAVQKPLVIAATAKEDAKTTAASAQKVDQTAQINQVRAEADLLAKEKNELELRAKEKAEAEKEALQKLALAQAAEKSLKEKLEAETRDRVKAESENEALKKSIAEKIAVAKAEADKTAAAKQPSPTEESIELAARIKLLESSLSAEKASRESLEKEKAAAENDAKEKSRIARAEVEKAISEKNAAVKASEDARREAKSSMSSAPAVAARKAEPLPVETSINRNSASDELEKELAALKSEKEKIARQLEDERAAREKAESEKNALEKLASANKAVLESAGTPAARAVKSRKKSSAKKTQSAAALREKAIAEYKRIVDSYSGSQAALSASAKLKELGIEYGEPTPAQSIPAMTSKARVLAFEVGQYAGVDMSDFPSSTSSLVKSRGVIPFEITNRGNGPDSFDISSPSSKDVEVAFLSVSDEKPVVSTPPLAPGEKFKALLAVTLPSRGIDGERFSFPIKTSSRFTSDVSRTREVKVVASAPLLRAIIKSDKSALLPGESATYSVTMLNVGSASADNLRFLLNYPPQLEPVNAASFAKDGAALVIDTLSLKSGESREYPVSFKLSSDAVANQELFVQGVFINSRLDRKDSFMGNSLTVQTRRGVRAVAATSSFTALPGQSRVIPVKVANEGNVREDFNISASLPSSVTYSIYHDQNRDGIKQAGEPVINHVGPLAPGETADVLIEIQTSKTSDDNTSLPVSIIFVSDAEKNTSAKVEASLTVVRPLVELQLNGKGGKLKPGELATLELEATNKGSSLARSVEIESIIPPEMEMVASEPTYSKSESGRYSWSFQELGSGEKRGIKVSYRIKSGTALGTSIQLQNLLSYQDSNGNRY